MNQSRTGGVLEDRSLAMKVLLPAGLMLLSWSAAAQCRAEVAYLGMFLQGTRIGYSSYVSSPSHLDGHPATRNDNTTILESGLEGAPMRIEMVSTSWTDKQGRPLRVVSSSKSSGRTQKFDAVFAGRSVIVKIDTSGVKSQRKIAVPDDGRIVDDPMALVMNGAMKVGAAASFYVLDTSSMSFVKTQVKFLGKSTTTVRGKSVAANLTEISDPHSNMRVFTDGKGNLVRAEGPMGIEMLPLSRREALAKPKPSDRMVDLAEASSIKPDRPIHDPAHVHELKLRLTVQNLGNPPSGEFQTVSRDGDGWIIDVHPPQNNADAGTSIPNARSQKPEWTKPSMNLPAQNSRFVTLAKRIVGQETQVHPAAFAIRKYVYQTMRPNAGIGVLRDAGEVLDSKEGVCRDYAVLTVTLLRAAGIPARLASGIVTWDGTFYYHAWAEAYDGRHWIGIDSTSDDNQISAAHVKLGEGNVEQAFSFTFLDKAKISVLSTEPE